MKLALLTLLALPLAAQTPASNWAGCGGGYSPDSSPKATAWCGVVLPVVQSQALYSFTLYQSTFYRGVPTILTTTGFLTTLRTYSLGTRGTVDINGVGTGGASTSSKSLTGATSLGGQIVWRKNNVAFLLTPLWNKAGGLSQATYLAGFAFSWK